MLINFSRFRVRNVKFRGFYVFSGPKNGPFLNFKNSITPKVFRISTWKLVWRCFERCFKRCYAWLHEKTEKNWFGTLGGKKSKLKNVVTLQSRPKFWNYQNPLLTTLKGHRSTCAVQFWAIYDCSLARSITCKKYPILCCHTLHTGMTKFQKWTPDEPKL